MCTMSKNITASQMISVINSAIHARGGFDHLEELFVKKHRDKWHLEAALSNFKPRADHSGHHFRGDTGTWFLVTEVSWMQRSATMGSLPIASHFCPLWLGHLDLNVSTQQPTLSTRWVKLLDDRMFKQWSSWSFNWIPLPIAEGYGYPDFNNKPLVAVHHIHLDIWQLVAVPCLPLHPSLLLHQHQGRRLRGRTAVASVPGGRVGARGAQRRLIQRRAAGAAGAAGSGCCLASWKNSTSHRS